MATDLSERCRRVEQRYVGQSGSQASPTGSRDLKRKFRTATLR